MTAFNSLTLFYVRSVTASSCFVEITLCRRETFFWGPASPISGERPCSEFARASVRFAAQVNDSPLCLAISSMRECRNCVASARLIANGAQAPLAFCRGPGGGPQPPAAGSSSGDCEHGRAPRRKMRGTLVDGASRVDVATIGAPWGNRWIVLPCSAGDYIAFAWDPLACTSGLCQRRGQRGQGAHVRCAAPRGNSLVPTGTYVAGRAAAARADPAPRVGLSRLRGGLGLAQIAQQQFCAMRNTLRLPPWASWHILRQHRVSAGHRGSAPRDP